ncbi:MAG: hypothetical protein AAGG08_02025 [Actinomycetota bacterium]
MAVAVAGCADSDDDDTPSASSADDAVSEATTPSDGTEDDDTAAGTATDDPAPDETNVADEANDIADDSPDEATEDASPNDEVSDGGDATAADPPATAIPVPPVFEGEDILVVGSNAWPHVGDLLALGVTPVSVFTALGNQEQPGYITESYGDVMADVPINYVDLLTLNPEAIAAVDFDRAVLAGFFEQVLAGQEIWLEVLGDDVIYLPATDWRESIGILVEAAGENGAPALAELEAEYQRRIDEIAASLTYDPSDVVFNTFQWNEDGTYLSGLRQLPIVQIVSELGFQLHPSLEVDFTTPPKSQETVTDMDADLLFVQVRFVEFESFQADPLWQTTSVAQTDNVFERFQYGQQAGWLETLALLDQLAVDLPRYQPATS